MTASRARCDVCGDIVGSSHPWDVRTCSCGRLTVSGGPKHRRVQWSAEPGAGWTDLGDEPEDEPNDELANDELGDDGVADEDVGDDRAADDGGSRLGARR